VYKNFGIAYFLTKQHVANPSITILVINDKRKEERFSLSTYFYIIEPCWWSLTLAVFHSALSFAFLCPKMVQNEVVKKCCKTHHKGINYH
jgi:hypothetical protein